MKDEHATNFAPTLTREIAFRAPPSQGDDIGRAIMQCGELMRVIKYAMFRGHCASARWQPGRLLAINDAQAMAYMILMRY